MTADVDLKKNGREVTCLYPDYYEAVEQAGGIPIIIPQLKSRQDMRALVRRLDGIVLTGGDDYHPKQWGEEPTQEFTPILPRREEFDVEFIHVLIESGIPTFGICGGLQLLNIALGGTLFQDIPAQVPNAIAHNAKAPQRIEHAITVTADSVLTPTATSSAPPLDYLVRSYHHQSIKEVAPMLRVIATAADGVIEACQADTQRCLFGVQWHPEKSLPQGGPDPDFALHQFNVLVSAATDHAASRRGAG